MSNSEIENPESKAPQENTATKTGAKMSNAQKVRLIVTTSLVLLLIAFVVQNYNKVKVEFLMFEFRIRIVTIILVSALIGSFITLLIQYSRKAKSKK